MFLSKQKTKNNQAGIAIVFVMTILFSIMFSVLIISSIIAGEIKVSQNVVDSVASFYIAESGIEKSLYYLKLSRDNNDFSHFTSLNDTSTTIPYGGYYHIATSSLSAPNYTTNDISTSTPVFVDIIDPPGNVSGISWGSADTFDVDWSVLNCFPDYTASRLQISVNSFGDNFANPTSETHLAICNCSFGSDDCDTYSGSVAGNRYYRFTFKPIDIKAKQIDFSINNSGNGIPSESYIESYGVYGRSKYHMTAQLPAFGSTYDIFQYVIFSEEDLSK